MSPHRIRRWLLIASVVQGALAVAALTTAALLPLEIHPKDFSTLHVSGPAGSAKTVSEDPTLRDFEPIVARRFQRALFDPPPPAPPPVVEPPPPTPPQIQLLATMIEPSGNQAMLTDATGRTVIRGIGATVPGGSGDASIVQIKPNAVVVHYVGESFTLPLASR